MTIQTGDRIPDAMLMTMVDGNPKPVSTSDVFAGKKVVLFAVPGAFTPTCSARHLPGFIDHVGEFHAAGVDTVACMAVNDVYVMDAWSKSAGADRISMPVTGSWGCARNALPWWQRTVSLLLCSSNRPVSSRSAVPRTSLPSSDF